MIPFSSKDRSVSTKISSKRSLDLSGVEYTCEKTFVVLNDRSLTNQKDGLSNSLDLTNQDFYDRPVDEKKTKKTIASLQAVPSPSGAHFDFSPSLSRSCLALPR